MDNDPIVESFHGISCSCSKCNVDYPRSYENTREFNKLVRAEFSKRHCSRKSCRKHGCDCSDK